MSRLTLLAPLGAALFTLAWLVLGSVSPGYRLFDIVIEPYSPIAQPISGLGLGVTAVWMNAAFILSGLLIIVGVVASRQLWPVGRAGTVSTVALSVTGVGMVIDGIFTLESVMLHLLGFLLAVGGGVVGFVAASVALRRPWKRGLVVLASAAGVVLALFAIFMGTFDPYGAGANAGIAGLVQRALVTVLLGGITFLTLMLRTRSLTLHAHR